MPRITCLRLLLLLPFLLVGSCGTAPKRISGTDLPTIPRVTLSSSEVTASKSSIATDGMFVFTGPVYDALERLRWISRAYVEGGWTPERPEGTPSKATQVFSKAARKLDLKRSVTITAVASRTTGTVEVELHSEPLASE